jgi:hypothetical protein
VLRTIQQITHVDNEEPQDRGDHDDDHSPRLPSTASPGPLFGVEWERMTGQAAKPFPDGELRLPSTT